MADGTLPPEVRPETKLIIVSHDCDIVQDGKAEPFIELIVAHPVTAAGKDSRLFRGKNPRKLQIYIQEGDAKNLYELIAHERFTTPRQHLYGREPQPGVSLGGGDVTVLGKWLSRRYKRYSFPTAFNNRIPSKNWNKLQKVLEREGDDVRLFVAFNAFEELPNDKPYEVLVFVGVPSDALENDFREQRALKVVAAISECLSACAGITLIDVKLRSEADISIEEMERQLIEWDAYDYISGSTSETSMT